MALSYMHSNNVVYRDMKPENILFYSTKTDIVKLVDFGTAVMIDQKKDERLSEMVGSPYYLAPEVIQGNYDHKCDIWSLGVICYAMLCKNMPFDGDADEEIINQILKKPITFDDYKFKFRSIECVDVLKKMLYKDATTRITANGAMQHKWFTTYAFEAEDKRLIINALKNFRNFINTGPL